MATDHQKIHPAHDVESPAVTPTAPLVPRSMSKSDKAEPGAPAAYPPPPQRTLPVRHSKPPKRRSCCCKFLCWIISLLLILIVAIGITIGILYLVFRPKFPKYSVNSLEISQFNLSSNNELSATFNVTITARNPNKKIGIYYQGGSRISSYYEDTELCEGSMPVFYQGHKNTTVLSLFLSGKTEDATGLFTTLEQREQQSGNIPLDLHVKQPVRVKLGKLKLFQVKFKIRCRLVVDSLSANDQISIQSSSCKFKRLTL